MERVSLKELKRKHADEIQALQDECEHNDLEVVQTFLPGGSTKEISIWCPTCEKVLVSVIHGACRAKVQFAIGFTQNEKK